MKVEMYCVYDKKTMFYEAPQYFHNVGHAMRTYGRMFMNERSMVSFSPEDYDIFTVGVFDDQSGKITAYPEPRFVCNALNVIHACMEAQKLNELYMRNMTPDRRQSHDDGNKKAGSVRSPGKEPDGTGSQEQVQHQSDNEPGRFDRPGAPAARR